jgi:Predicted membrane protein (DUF2232)
VSLRIALVGIGAGAAAALLFALVTTGSLLSAVLVYLAPLPVLIAGIGWSHWAALIGAVFGGIVIAALFGPMYLFAFMIGAGLPAWWLSYLTLLARPGGNGADSALEWYPPGRLVMWAAIAAVLLVSCGILYSGPDAATFRAHMHKTLAALLRVETGAPTSQASSAEAGDMQRLIDFLVDAVPPAATVLATVTNVVNLWLAARIVKSSGRLARPWPQIAAMTLPRPLLLALLAALVLSFAGGLAGMLAGVTTAGLLMAYGVLGFAVMHVVTRDSSARGLLLGGAYASVLVFGWPILAFCLIGLLDATIDLRARFARKRGPPASPP